MARIALPQESPLSPLEAAAPPASAQSEERSPYPGPVAAIPVAAPGATLPLGEPRMAQTSMVLVGLVIAGLLALVVLIVIRQRCV